MTQAKPENSAREEDIDPTLDRETRPSRGVWPRTVVASIVGIVPIGMACAAAAVSNNQTSERVAITAWVATAIVGTASVISAAAAVRPRRGQRGPT